MQIKKSKLKLMKSISRAGMIVFIFLSVFNLGTIFGSNRQEGESIIDFMTKEMIWEYNTYEKPPQEAIDRINEYNKIVSLVRIALVFLFLTLFFDYFIDPEHHFITKIKEKLKLEE